PLYRVFANYTSRLNLMLTGGRHVCPVAFLFPGYSTHIGTAVTPEEMTTALQDALYDCDWIPYEVFEKDIQLVGKELQVRNERYRVLIVPSVGVIPLATLEKARRFLEQGGVVIGYGSLPSKSATLGHPSAEIRALAEEIWGDATSPGLQARKTSASGGRSYFLSQKPTVAQLQQVLAQDAGIHPDLEVLEGQTNDWLHVLHRAKSGRDVFLVCNENVKGEAEQFRMRIKAQGVPECWDALRNEITAIPFERKDADVRLTLTLEPLESVLIVFQPEKRSLPPRWSSSSAQTRQTIPVSRDPRSIAATPKPPMPPASDSTRRLEGCSWVWYPERAPAASAPPGTRFFRKELVVPGDRAIKQALFLMSADNEFRLFVNGKKAGQSHGGAGDRTRPAEIDLTRILRPGPTVLAITATNTSSQPNPAGLIGLLRIEFDRGDPVDLPIDKSWKVNKIEHAGWKDPAFDDSSWPSARVIAPLGGAPWGKMTGSGPTLSPVRADPFVGRAAIPGDLELAGARVYLEMDEIRPEAAARVTINGQDAGGFIGRPLRLDVTGLIRTGGNTIKIEPFAPHSARLVVARP
ncbi:MAG: glycosyl hydrolase, partial [Isosphaeraceae bacterium]